LPEAGLKQRIHPTLNRLFETIKNLSSMPALGYTPCWQLAFKLTIEMKSYSKFAAMALGLAALANFDAEPIQYNGKSKVYTPTTLSKKQRKRRAAAKRENKARSKQHRS
jgi:hypothetical protein